MSKGSATTALLLALLAGYLIGRLHAKPSAPPVTHGPTVEVQQ